MRRRFVVVSLPLTALLLLAPSNDWGRGRSMLVHACCPSSCNGHGVCTHDGNGCVCSCFKGFTGGDCSRRTCPVGPAWSDMAIATDRAHQPAECSGRGLCDYTTGTCTCDLGFTGLACNRLSCPNSCSQQGDCRSMKFHAFRKDKGLGPPMSYDSVWDSTMMYGCVCDDGYMGGDCSQRSCARGDDPLTGASTDTLFGLQGNEKQTVFCAATDGTFTLSFRGQTTTLISASDKADAMSEKLNALVSLRRVNVMFSGTSTTACTADGTVVTVEFTQDYGALPLLVGDGRKLVHASVGLSPTLEVTLAEQGTKENELCANRGRCDRITGVCTCFTGFTTSGGNGLFGDRGDCGAVESTITACPGEIACSGHGYCTGAPQFRCVCMDGWAEGDCGVRECPRARAWFDLPIADNHAHRTLLPCAGVGVCDPVLGECICPVPFQGGACERMACPGAVQACSGHGRCLTMAQLAVEATLPDGDPLPGITYGATPNNPRTWDATRVLVCQCDDGFEGHDCSKRSCPRGDDPHTTGQVHEVQTLQCQHTGTAVSFKVAFRGVSTAALAMDLTKTDFQTALANVHAIGQVLVRYSTGDSLCTLASSGVINTVTIEFVEALGDVPPLRLVPSSVVDMTLLPVFQINTDGVGGSVRGTVEDVECSNNGLCDYNSGQCVCFEGMGSSNGRNAPGLRLDCGFILPTDN